MGVSRKRYSGDVSVLTRADLGGGRGDSSSAEEVG